MRGGFRSGRPCRGRSGSSDVRRQIAERLLECIERAAAEKDEDRAVGRVRLRQAVADGPESHGSRLVERVAVDARADRRKGDTSGACLIGQMERLLVGGTEQFFLAQAAAAPDRPNGMDDPLDAVFAQTPRAGDDGAPRRAAPVAGAQLGHQLGPGRAMNGSVDAAPTGQLLIRGVDDGVDADRGYVALDQFDPGRRSGELGNIEAVGAVHVNRVVAESTGLTRPRPWPILRVMDDKPRVQPAARAEWRGWLAANHRASSGVWLVTWKRATGRPTVAYEEAVEEALCFGWIDGVMRRVDDERLEEWFAPRRPKSTWAKTNKERVARLEAAGLMTDAGRRAIEIARANGSWESLDAIDSLVVPDDLAAALSDSPGARDRFDASSASVRRSALAWVYQAKRPATRAARVERVAAVAASGEPISSIWQRRD